MRQQARRMDLCSPLEGLMQRRFGCVRGGCKTASPMSPRTPPRDDEKGLPYPRVRTLPCNRVVFRTLMPHARFATKISAGVNGESAPYTIVVNHGTPDASPPHGLPYPYRQTQTHQTTSSNSYKAPEQQQHQRQHHHQHPQERHNRHTPGRTTHTTQAHRLTNSPTCSSHHLQTSTTSLGTTY